MNALICTRDVLRTTLDILRRGGARGEERVVLWLATASAPMPTAIVEVFEPEQVNAADRFHLPPSSMRSLMAHLRETRRRIAAQVHTHPKHAFHSDADAEWAIVRQDGAFSLVLPYFAAATTPETFLRDVMIYEHTSAGDWAHRAVEASPAPLVIVP